MIERVVPLYSTRRLAWDLTRDVIRHPSTLRRRLNRRNLHHWREARGVQVTCIVCGHEGHLLDEMLDSQAVAKHPISPAQETLRCRECGSRMRDRLFAAGLLDLLFARGVIAPNIAALVEVLPAHFRILDLEPDSAIGDLLAAHPGYVHAAQEPGATGRTDGDGLQHVDLEHLPYADRSFHVVIASDALDHVADLACAHREIARCLRDIGAYLFTASYDGGLDRSFLLDPVSGRVLTGTPALATLAPEDLPAPRLFGRDLFESLLEAGLSAELVGVRRPEIGVPGGGLFFAAPLRSHQEPDGRALPRQGGSAAEGGDARPSTHTVSG